MTIISITWILYDYKTPYKGGRKWKAFRNYKIWKYFRDYFPITLVKTEDLPPDKNYMFCVYPHGIASSASFLNFMSNANGFDDLYPGIEPFLVILNANFRIPYSRDFFLAIGAVGASQESLLNCLTSKPGASCVLMPGGAGEALRARPGTCNILLKNRKGFIKIALKSGASLVPVFSFGENEIFDQITGSRIRWFQDRLRTVLGLAPCIIKGRGFFQYSVGLLPQRRPIITVVGKPIPVPKIEIPTQELINEYHQKYVDALFSLFNKYKGKYHPKGNNIELNIE